MANILAKVVEAASRSWSQRKEELEAKIIAVRARRDGFVNERHSLLPAAADGDAEAQKRAKFLYDAISDADREISDLQKVYADAAQHVEAEKAVRAQHAEAKRMAAVEQSVQTWREKAAAIDEAVDALAFVITDYQAACEDVTGRVQHSEMNGHIADIYGKIPMLINSRLALTRLIFKGGALPGADLQIATKLCDSQRILALAARKV